MNKICQYIQVRNLLYTKFSSDIKERINNKSYLNSIVQSLPTRQFALEFLPLFSYFFFLSPLA